MTQGWLADTLVRLACRSVAGALFRVRVLGAENIPAHGPALLVSNHLTFLDGFLIGSCLSKPPRFLVWKPYYDFPLFTWAFRMAKCIPIWTGPHSIAESLRRASYDLECGEVLCIFAEGSISRTGALLPFKRGVEAIACGLSVPIVPVHLGGLWESIFSYRDGRFFWKRPRRLRHPVLISFGPPLPPSSTASEIRRAVERLATTGRE